MLWNPYICLFKGKKKTRELDAPSETPFSHILEQTPSFKSYPHQNPTTPFCLTSHLNQEMYGVQSSQFSIFRVATVRGGK